VFTSSDQIQKSYVSDLTDNLPKLEKKASEAIKSFAALVDELNKVSQLSSGTPVNKQVKELSANMNNTQVFFTKMLIDQLGAMNNIVKGDGPQQEVVS
jgi:hypothetical protein